MIIDADSVPGLQGGVALLLAQHAQALPPYTLAAVLMAQAEVSPHPRFVVTCEALYAVADQLGEGPRQLGLSLAQFIMTTYAPLIGPGATGDPSRAPGIVRAFRRRLGLIDAEAAPPAADPPPLPQYLAPAE